MTRPALLLLALALFPAVNCAASCSEQSQLPFYCFKERAWHQWDQFKAYRTFINTSSEFMDQCTVPPLADWVMAEDHGSPWKAQRPKDWDYTKDYTKAEVQDNFLAAASLAALSAQEKSLSFRKWQDDWMNECTYAMLAPRHYEAPAYANKNPLRRTTPDVIADMLKGFFLPGKGASDALTRKAVLLASLMPKDNAAAFFSPGMEGLIAAPPSAATLAAAIKSLAAIRPDLNTDRLLGPILGKGKDNDPAVSAAVCDALGAIVRKAVKDGAAQDLKVLESRIPGIQAVGIDAPERSALKESCSRAFRSYPRAMQCKYMACLDASPAAKRLP